MKLTTIDLTDTASITRGGNHKVRILALRLLGLLCVGLGIVGAVLPLLPTTCFFIAAVYCFAISNPAWQQRILDHPRFGPPVQSFVRDRTLSRRAKIIALGGIAANFVLSLLVVDMTPVTIAILAAVLATASAYIASRPEPASDRAATKVAA
jgi:uncharacterized membrane protein YbaN (DUF454 family)